MGLVKSKKSKISFSRLPGGRGRRRWRERFDSGILSGVFKEVDDLIGRGGTDDFFLGVFFFQQVHDSGQQP